MQLYIPEWLPDNNIVPNTEEHWNNVYKMLLMFEYWNMMNNHEISEYFRLLNSDTNVALNFIQNCFRRKGFVFDENKHYKPINEIVHTPCWDAYTLSNFINSKLIKQLIIRSQYSYSQFELVIDASRVFADQSNEIIEFMRTVIEKFNYGLSIICEERAFCIKMHFKNEDDLILAKLMK